MIDDLRRQQMDAVNRRQKRRQKHLIAALIGIFLVLAAALIFLFGDRRLQITRYRVETDKVSTDWKLVVMSDLHSWEFDKNNRTLIQTVTEEAPDAILMLGDMVNKEDKDISVIRYLCSELKNIAPVYYSMGNHEGVMMNGRMDSIAIDKILREDGVFVLYNETGTIEKNGDSIMLAGISTSEENYDKWSKGELGEFWNADNYKILLSHYPSLYYDKLKDADVDLALAGHYHGGLIRIPGMGGLFHPDDGFFPRYAGGQYELDNGTLIVTRGLGNHGIIPRINNRPELVTIEIHERKKGEE